MTQTRKKEADSLNELTRVLLELQGAMAEMEVHFTKPHGQTPARWKVMVAASSDTLTVPQIARRMGLTRQAVQKVAHSLVEDDLAFFEANPDHMASPHLVLTPRGHKLEKKITDGYRTWSGSFAADLNPSRLAAATRTLKELHARLGTPKPRASSKGKRRG